MPKSTSLTTRGNCNIASPSLNENTTHEVHSAPYVLLVRMTHAVLFVQNNKQNKTDQTLAENTNAELSLAACRRLKQSDTKLFRSLE